MLRSASRRWYSTGGEKSMFLSDLLTRIDNIALNSQKIKQQELLKKKEAAAAAKEGGFGSQQKNGKPTKKLGRAGSTLGSSMSAQSKIRSRKVQVSDHPMASQAFSAMQDSGRSRFEGRHPRSATSVGTAQRDRRPKSASRTASGAQANRRAMAPRKPKKLAPVDVKPVVSKSLTTGPLKPDVDADVFLYGKISSVSPCLTSRVASVTKELLIKSQYPYKLPRSVVDSLEDTPTNRFLALNTYSTEVDGQALAARISEVVRGKAPELATEQPQKSSPEAAKMAAFARSQLMKNGDLDLVSKELIYKVASGLHTPKSLLEGKHWAK